MCVPLSSIFVSRDVEIMFEILRPMGVRQPLSQVAHVWILFKECTTLCAFEVVLDTILALHIVVSALDLYLGPRAFEALSKAHSFRRGRRCRQHCLIGVRVDGAAVGAPLVALGWPYVSVRVAKAPSVRALSHPRT